MKKWLRYTISQLLIVGIHLNMGQKKAYFIAIAAGAGADVRVRVARFLDMGSSLKMYKLMIHDSKDNNSIKYKTAYSYFTSIIV